MTLSMYKTSKCNLICVGIAKLEKAYKQAMMATYNYTVSIPIGIGLGFSSKSYVHLCVFLCCYTLYFEISAPPHLAKYVL